MADSPEEKKEKDLFAQRKAARGNDDSCPADELVTAPDIAPPQPIEPCDDPIVEPTDVFLPPADPPEDPADPSLLPPPVYLYSRETVEECPVGRVALDGVSPTVTPVGYDIQLAYLDSIPEITQTELFRLAEKVEALQSLADSSLIAAIDASDYTSFEEAIVEELAVSAVVAISIRSLLVGAQQTADSIALAYTSSLLTCGWLSQDLWVVCSTTDIKGYEVFTADPEADEQKFIAAGAYQSLVSQEDADERAAREAALQLDCLIGNDEQTENCLSVSASFGVALDWPVTENDSSTWETTESITLADLNLRTFYPESEIGGEGRTLNYSVTVPAGDPRAAAATKEQANEIAKAIALQSLDCFFPSRPRLISCSHATLGSSSVRDRKAAKSYDDDAMFDEMEGGDIADGGETYVRLNVGVSDPGGPAEALDTNPAYEVTSPAGIVIADVAADANSSAETRAVAYLSCSWISPKHSCTCVASSASQTDVSSSKFTSEEVTSNEANFRPDLSSPLASGDAQPQNVLERGLFVSNTFPGEDIGDDTVWPDLSATCNASLTCVFDACKVVYCTPKPDDREWKVNGMPNFASYGPAWNTHPSDASQQNAFMAEWDSRLVGAISDTFSGPDAPCASYSNADACSGATSPANITDEGPRSYGTPARFKFGGVLKLGYTWGSTASSSAGGPSLQAGTTVLDCSQISGDSSTLWQEPELWGFFSGAEGYARDLSPIALGEQAATDAASRLDCTHMAWPRALFNCAQNSQRPFGPVPFHLDLPFEGSSTREANEQAESMILAVMECRDTHNFALTIDGSKLQITSPVVAKTGDDKCMDKGLHAAELRSEDGGILSASNLSLGQGTEHIFIEVKCLPDEGVKSLVLHRVGDPGVTPNAARAAQQNGEFGVSQGRAALQTLKGAEGSGEIWYIGTIVVNDLGGSSDDDEYIVVQAYSGAIIIGESCCNSSSSSSSSGSAPSSSGSSGGSSGSSGSSGDSGSSGSSGDSGSSGGGGSGSDKSTAIVQDPMGEFEVDYIAFFCMEMAEPRFEEVVDLPLIDGFKGGSTFFQMCPRYIRSCERDTIRICSAQGKSTGLPVRAIYHNASESVELKPNIAQRLGQRVPDVVTLRLSAIRKGFLGKRNSRRNRLQYLANEEWLNSAYPGYSD